MTVTRSALIKAYWLEGRTLEQTADLFGVSKDTMRRRFQRFGILRRRCNKRANRMRLELMLWPSLWEWQRERIKSMLE